MSNYLFIIISVIYFTDRPLSYTERRSVFNPADRIKQTLHTISSIRAKVPQAQILLVEIGRPGPLIDLLRANVDHFIFLGDSQIVRWSCDGPHKGLGEAIALIALIRQLPRADFYFKISGRYFLNDHFNLASWHSSNHRFVANLKDGVFNTRLYGFPIKLLNKLIFKLYLSLPFLFFGRSIEGCLWNFLKSNTTSLDPVGVSGLIAVENNSFIEN